MPSSRARCSTPGAMARVDPFGSCNVLQAYSPEGWRVDGKFTADWSLMHLDCAIGDTVGWLGFFWKAGADGLKGLKVRVEGYPGDKPFGTQWRMNGTISASNKNMAYYNDRHGGRAVGVAGLRSQQGRVRTVRRRDPLLRRGPARPGCDEERRSQDHQEQVHADLGPRRRQRSDLGHGGPAGDRRTFISVRSIPARTTWVVRRVRCGT